MPLAKTEEGKIDLVLNLTIGVWIVLSISFGIYFMMQSWQKISQEEADYRSLGWKNVDSQVIELGSINGDFKPVSQTATLQYHYHSEGVITTQQQIGLGYHVSDNVSLFANKNGDVVVKNVPNGSRAPYDPTIRSFGGDYTGSLFIGVFAGIAAAICLVIAAFFLVLVFAGALFIFEAIFKSKKEPQAAS